jgi:hypothetical protein
MPREHTTANLHYPRARVGDCNVVLAARSGAQRYHPVALNSEKKILSNAHSGITLVICFISDRETILLGFDLVSVIDGESLGPG